MTAPDSVVSAVQEALGCELRGGSWRYCHEHGSTFGSTFGGWDERGCETARKAADAAWAVAYPAALRGAAENLHLVAEVMATTALTAADARETLRRWADESEAAK